MPDKEQRSQNKESDSNWLSKTKKKEGKVKWKEEGGSGEGEIMTCRKKRNELAKSTFIIALQRRFDDIQAQKKGL